MGYMMPPGMAPWRTPKEPPSDARIRAMAKQLLADDNTEIFDSVYTLSRRDRARLQDAINSLPTPGRS